MERLTYISEPGFIDIVCDKSGCSEDTGCLNCKTTRAFMKLKEYEDKAQRKEKGCTFCKISFPTVNDDYKLRIGSSDEDMLEIERLNKSSMEFDKLCSFRVRYCPYCGRKLVEESWWGE